MRDQLFAGVLLTGLLICAFPAPAVAEDETIATCPAAGGAGLQESLVAYGSVSGGRLYLKRIEMKVGDVTLTPPLPHQLYSATYTSNKLSAQIERTSKDVREAVRDGLQTKLNSFTIEANPHWGYQITVSGGKPYPSGGPGAWTSNDFSFEKCVLSQSAKDALEAAHYAKSASKIPPAGGLKITMTPTSSAR